MKIEIKEGNNKETLKAWGLMTKNLGLKSNPKSFEAMFVTFTFCEKDEEYYIEAECIVRSEEKLRDLYEYLKDPDMAGTL